MYRRIDIPSFVQALSQVKAAQVAQKNSHLGVDCNQVCIWRAHLEQIAQIRVCVSQNGTMDMKAQGVFETMIGKQQQLQLATQVVKMILKIDDVIEPTEINQ